MGSRARSEERKKRKKKRKKQQQLDPSSSSPSSSSSSSSTDISTSSEERRKSTRKKPRQSTSPSQSEYSRLKHKKRRHSRRAEKAEKYSRRENSSKKAHHKSQTDEGRVSPSPQEVAYTFLIKFPDLAADLVQLLKMLDDGQAVDLSGLANDHVKAYLKQLFQSLLLQRTTHGLYFLPDGAPRKTLHVLSSVVSSSENINDSVQAVQKKEEIQVLKDTVQMSNEEDGCNDQYGPIEKQRRVLGPVMPSTEVLEAAARMMEADQSLRLSGSPNPSTEILEDAARMTEAGLTLREANEDILSAPFIGPPPPAAVKEAESANEAERFEEVERILAPDVENAYELLGLRVGASAELLKKRYWKISLLVHPDKCGHPQAHQAFTALNQAFKDLQDPVKRAKVDEQIQEKETRKEFEAEMRKNREAAQWRKIKGESLPGDDALLDPPKAMVRDEWMTQLPPERKPGAPAQQSMFFSKYGKSGRGDTSAWTDTPMDRIQKAKMMCLEDQKWATLNDEEVAFCKEDTNPVTARIVDEFNSAKRGMSLLEKHEMEHSKKKKKSYSKQEAQQPPEWVGSHPWKPWDREKDLTAGRQKVNLDKSNMAEGLSSRFASSHKERSFL